MERDTNALNRRRFLQVTAVGVLATLTATACAGGDDSSAPPEPALVEMLGSERVRQIGMQYRAEVPQESNAAALRGLISTPHRRGLARIYRRSIEDKIRNDFAEGRIVVASGWVLSQTEARQCALYSLSA